MWVLACYAAGFLVFQANFAYEGACNQEGLRMQRSNPGWSCRPCVPVRTYRPKRD